MTPLEQIVSIGVSLSVAAVLLAVVVNFVNRTREAEYEEEPCPVVTLTMVAFFIGEYLLIRFRIGAIEFVDPVTLALAIVGLPLVIAGAVINLLGRGKLGSNWADKATLYKSQSLVTTGVYRWVRHPLYSSLILMFIGAGLAYHNLLALLATCAIFIPAMIWRANTEEKMLAVRFPEYDEYRKRTGRLFPKSRRG